LDYLVLTRLEDLESLHLVDEGMDMDDANNMIRSTCAQVLTRR
jgi:hypothetical protein